MKDIAQFALLRLSQIAISNSARPARVLIILGLTCGLQAGAAQQDGNVKFEPIRSGDYAEVNAKDGDSGFNAQYFAGRDLLSAPVVERLEGHIRADRQPLKNNNSTGYSARWSATVTPKVSGRFPLSLRATGKAVVKWDGKVILERKSESADGVEQRLQNRLSLERGKPYELLVEFYNPKGDSRIALEWAQPEASLAQESITRVMTESFAGPKSGEIVGPRVVLKNAAYSVASEPDGTLIVTDIQGGAVGRFAPEFSVCWQRPGQQTKMDPRGGKYQDSGPVGSINYMVPSWEKEVDYLTAAHPRTKLRASKATPTNDGIQWMFPPQKEYEFSAQVTLPQPGREPLITWKLKAREEGQFSVGFVGAPAMASDKADWIWQPLVWQGKRFPNRSYMTKEFQCPIPAVMFGKEGTTIGLAAGANEMPYRMPTMQDSRFGVLIRNSSGEAQPLLFAPVLGGPEDRILPGKSYEFQLHLVARKSDWYGVYKHLAQTLYEFKDIRENGLCSLNTTIDNMMDYLLTDYSYWFPNLKAWGYQNDAGPGSGRQQSAADALSLALVCDNRVFYEQRALPTLEYMLSRNATLIHTNRPTFMGGFVNAPADMIAAYRLTGNRTTIIRKIFERSDNQSDSKAQWLGENTSVMQIRTRMLEDLAQYRLTGGKGFLKQACAAADRYIEVRVKQPPKNYRDAGSSFWHELSPAFDVLYELYQETGDVRYLRAAESGMRDFTAYIYMVPAIPSGDFVANPGGMYNGHPVPEERVPAWRVSANGLTAECAGTAHSHRGVFMAPHAAWLSRLSKDTGDIFFRDIARNAVVGRYCNYPSYAYRNGYSTVYEKAEYPLRTFEEIKKFTSAHYNHPLPMTAFLIDYLVSETYLRSDGQIEFPSDYTTTGAYFRNKVYGARPGRFFGEKEVHLWLPKGLLKSDSIQVNYLSGYGNGKLYLALANQSAQPVLARFTVAPESVKLSGERTARLWKDNAPATPITLKDGVFTIHVSAKGLASLAIEGAEVNADVQRAMLDPTSLPLPESSSKTMKTGFGDVTATALRAGKGLTSVHVWLRAAPSQVRAASVKYSIGGEEMTLTRSEFPFEFTIPVPDSETSFACRAYAETSSGAKLSSDPLFLTLIPERNGP